MTSIETISAELNKELRKPIDPRTVPVRFSNLQSMQTSPKAYFDRIQQPQESSRIMRYGSLADAIILGAHREFVVYSETQKRIGKKWDAFEAANQGVEIVTKSEYDHARRIADAVMSNSDAMFLLTGNRQQSIEWTFAGRKCRSRPDVFTDSFVTELKCTGLIETRRFLRYAHYESIYHAQLSFYRTALHRSGIAKPMGGYIVAAQNERPFDVVIYELNEMDFRSGETIWNYWFERLMECEKTGVWPGIADGIRVPYNAPAPSQDDLGGDFASELAA